MHGGSVCACLWLALAAPAALPEGGQLAGILERMASNFARIPNYTCTQTIDRWRGLEPCPKCAYSDRLRLEVAVIGGKEQFAWPGAGGFGGRSMAFHGRLRDARRLAGGRRPRRFPFEATGADAILFIDPRHAEIPRDLHFYWSTIARGNQ